MRDHKEDCANAVNVANKLTKLPVCKTCNGRKTIKPLFFELDCQDCFATGLDISDPLTVIRQQQEYLKQARVVIIEQRNSIYCLTVTPDEQAGEMMDKFYSLIKRMD